MRMMSFCVYLKMLLIDFDLIAHEMSSFFSLANNYVGTHEMISALRICLLTDDFIHRLTFFFCQRAGKYFELKLVYGRALSIFQSM